MAKKKISSLPKIAFTLTFVAILCTLSTQNIFATGWSGGSSAYSSGGCGTRKNSNSYFDTCVGGAWEYYEYVNGWKGIVYTMSLISTNTQAYGLKISEKCAEVGGFYSFGMIPYSPNALRSWGIKSAIESSYPDRPWRNKQQIGSVRKVGSATINMLSGEALEGIKPNSVARKSQSWKTTDAPLSNDQIGARAQYYSDPSKAYEAYKEAEEHGVTDPRYNADTVAAFCYTDKGWSSKASTFDSSSKATVSGASVTTGWSGWDSKTTTSYTTTSSSVTLDFEHKLRRVGTGDNISNAVSVGWTISSAYSASGTASWPANVAGEKSNIGGKSVTVNIARGETKTVCATITHASKISGNTSSGSESSTACITITREGGGSSTCETGRGAYHNNIGSTGVSKNGGDFSFSGDNPNGDFSRSNEFGNYVSLTSIWAKPGDSIQFMHRICAGAQSVVDDPKSDLGSSYNTSYDFSAITTFDGGANIDYLFGNTLGQRKNSISASELEGENYELAISSPSEGANYGCNQMSGSSIIGYYRIPSLSHNNNCRSASATRLSDAGNTITQTMSWKDLRAKVTRHHESWTDSEGHHHSRTWYTTDVDSTHNGSRTFTSAASVYVPYNYIIKPYIVRTDESNSIVTLGGEISTNVYLPVDKRENKQVGGTYATQTKPTKVKVISYVASSLNTPTSEISYYVDTNGVATNNLCSKIKGNGSDRTVTRTCRVVKEESDVILNENPTGNLDGTYSSSDSKNNNVNAGGSYYGNISATVPDAGDDNYNIGDRFCIAVATWPGDSHNSGAASSINKSNQQVALSDDAGSGAQWSISAPTCVTIAKNPTFSVEGSQLSTTGNVSSSVFNRSGKYYYSSWSEYGIVAAGAVNNTASGAATTYINALGLKSFSNPNYAIGLKETNLASVSAGAHNGGGQIFNSQTMYNKNVNKPGGATNLGIGEDIRDFYESIKNVYTRKADDAYRDEAGVKSYNDIYRVKNSWGRYVSPTKYNGYYDITPNAAYACKYDAQKGYYVVASGDMARATKIDSKTGREVNTAPYYCLDNGAKYHHVVGNAYIGNANDDSIATQLRLFVDDLKSGDSQETYRNQTMVIHVEGKLVIDANFIIANYYNGQEADRFTDIQQIPQIIIIADSIDITANVTRIDAWLIADIDNGTINTCAYDNFNGFRSGQYINSVGKSSTLTANKCSRELVINGPVTTKNLILNRTAGAGTQPSRFNYSGTSLQANDAYYVQRGEIFNLRPDAYLWGYYQAQRNGIITTVYSHEYPTRY